MAASEGRVIAGYYLANENYRDINADVGHKVADKIAENFPSACLVVVSNLKIMLFIAIRMDVQKKNFIFFFLIIFLRWTTENFHHAMKKSSKNRLLLSLSIQMEPGNQRTNQGKSYFSLNVINSGCRKRTVIFSVYLLVKTHFTEPVNY